MADQEQATVLTHLQHNYHLPTSQWWTDAAQKYSILCSLLNNHLTNISLNEQQHHQQEQQSQEEHENTPHNSSLPLITLLPAGTHTLRLASTDEDLDCVAFGTVRGALFLDLLWEGIARAQERGVSIIVHDVRRNGAAPRVVLSVEGRAFGVTYFRFPKILDATPDFLLQECGRDIADVIQSLQKTTLYRHQILDKSPARRTAYHFFRAWAITRGIFGAEFGYLSARDIVRLLQSVDTELEAKAREGIENGIEDLEEIVYGLYEQHASCKEEEMAAGGYICKYTPAKGWRRDWFRIFHQEIAKMKSIIDQQKEKNKDKPESQRVDWTGLLSDLESQPFYEKLDAQFYVKVKMMYLGNSRTACGKWISMVQENLPRLKQDLESRLSPKPTAHIWPQRLIAGTSGPEDDIYEGIFVLGVSLSSPSTSQSQTQPDILPRIEEISTQWTRQITRSELTLPNICILSIDVSPSSPPPSSSLSAEAHANAVATKTENLLPCSKTFPRPTVKLDTSPDTTNPSTEYDNHAFISATKNKKPNNNTSNEAAATALAAVKQPDEDASAAKTKLRPALDVLNRLRHDRDYDIDRFVVGYLDRFGGMREKRAAEWEADVSEEEFVPQSRIWYFKRVASGDGDGEGEDLVVWDREKKVDLIFEGRK
ncbi:hypothetical protein F5884DRAFT_747230 [Xylogone sp. PMI_703]|nr:hypothetical protein F5884DRAFT_747230 [Xylogone sp. PMI_703]